MMIPFEKKLHEILCVGGREFRIYVEYDESLGEYQPNYPDFSAKPEYTDEGRPFARSISSACQYWKPHDAESDFICGCGGCGFLVLESDNDRIGICMCEELKREPSHGAETGRPPPGNATGKRISQKQKEGENLEK